MRKSREELGRIHKQRCRELKEIRAKMAEDLGIELNQRECTYEGYCSGTCPKCKSEEMKLNAALLKRQLKEANIKGRVAAAGLTTVAAVSLSGCGLPGQQLEGDMAVPLEGNTVMAPENPGTAEEGNMPAPEETEEVTEGVMAMPSDTEMMDDYILEGDFEVMPETEN